MAYLKVELTGSCRAQLPDTIDDKTRTAIINVLLDKITGAWDALRSDEELSNVQTWLKFEVIEQAASINNDQEAP